MQTNWQMLPPTIDKGKTDWARTEYKRSLYVKDMREAWHRNQCRQDRKALLLRELDKISKLF
jgi:hypothetical protein